MYFQKARINNPVLYRISNYLDVTGMSQWLTQGMVILSNSSITTIFQAVITIKCFYAHYQPYDRLSKCLHDFDSTIVELEKTLIYMWDFSKDLSFSENFHVDSFIMHFRAS